jgi:hypothetical protein
MSCSIEQDIPPYSKPGYTAVSGHVSSTQFPSTTQVSRCKCGPHRVKSIKSIKGIEVSPTKEQEEGDGDEETETKDSV